MLLNIETYYILNFINFILSAIAATFCILNLNRKSCKNNSLQRFRNTILMGGICCLGLSPFIWGLISPPSTSVILIVLVIYLGISNKISEGC